MRIWRIADPGDYRFAQASCLGTWSTGSEPCAECGAGEQVRLPPLILTWEPGSDVVGDFTFTGFGADIAITERVANRLSDCTGFRAGAVQMIDKSSAESEKRERIKPRVSLPYKGPTLFEFCVTREVHLDRDRSSVNLIRECGSCGTKQYEALGIERQNATWNPDQGTLVKTRIPRQKDQGIFVARELINEATIFRTLEFPAWTLCTEAVKNMILHSGFNNVEFLEVGDTF